MQAKGNAAFQAGDFDEAIVHFSAGIQADPKNHVLYSNRSAAFASKQEFATALNDAKKVNFSSLHPPLPTHARLHARTFSHTHSQGKIPQIAAEGRLFHDCGVCSSLLPSFAQVVEIKADWAKGYSRLGAAYSGLRKWDESIDAYTKGV